MKTTLLLLCLLLATAAFAGIRENCENAYYATDYVELHEYRVSVEWSKVSDHMHVELEDLIFGPLSKCQEKLKDELSEELDTRGHLFWCTKSYDLNAEVTIYNIKEISGSDYYQYSSALERLNKLSSKGVSCLYKRP